MSDFDRAEIPFIFVIQTGSYAGNFEREITGYCTGVDDGTHGDEEAVLFLADAPSHIARSLPQKIMFSSGDSNYERCCSIWNYNGNSGYNDVAIFFENLPTGEELNYIAKRAKEYGEKHGIEIRGFAVISRTVKVDDVSTDWNPTES